MKKKKVKALEKYIKVKMKLAQRDYLRTKENCKDDFSEGYTGGQYLAYKTILNYLKELEREVE